MKGWLHLEESFAQSVQSGVLVTSCLFSFCSEGFAAKAPRQGQQR